MEQDDELSLDPSESTHHKNAPASGQLFHMYALQRPSSRDRTPLVHRQYRDLKRRVPEGCARLPSYPSRHRCRDKSMHNACNIFSVALHTIITLTNQRISIARASKGPAALDPNTSRMPPRALNIYAVLSLKKGCSKVEVRKAYRKLSLKYHPDRFSSGTHAEKEAAKNRFQEINEAYHTLIDDDKRRVYDHGTHSSHSGREWGAASNNQPSYCQNTPPTPAPTAAGETADLFGSVFGNAGEQGERPAEGDFRTSFFDHTADKATEGFARWGNLRPNPKNTRQSPRPGGGNGAASACQRLMDEAKRCFSRFKKTNRGSKADGAGGYRPRSRTIPVPPADAQSDSGRAAMGHRSRSGAGRDNQPGLSVPGCSSPSSGDFDDDDDTGSDRPTDRPSRVVVLHGLKSDTARMYNGKIGRVLDARNDSDRWRIQIPGISRVFRLLPSNVLSVPCGILRGLRTKSSLNGRCVILLGSAADGSNRYDCTMVPEQTKQREHKSRKYCVRPKNLVLSPGTLVDILPRGTKTARYGGGGVSNTRVLSFSRDSASQDKQKSGGWYTLSIEGLTTAQAPKARARDVWVSFASYNSVMPFVHDALRLV